MRRRHQESDRLFLKYGDVLHGRYKVLDLINDGGYSNVYACVDLKTNSQLVVKACRNKGAYHDAAKDEVKTMETLMKIDPRHKHFVRFYESFVYRDHICLVCEKLGPSLFSVMEANHYDPFPIEAIRSIMFQIITAVDLLHRNNMVHTDLKLENILLCDTSVGPDGRDSRGRLQTNVRLIDFGSLESGTHWNRHLVTTRHYRAPEILMGLRWGYECDIWSLGCIMLELATGAIDFDSRDAVEHLFRIQEMVHPIPKWMWRECTAADLEPFVRDGKILDHKIPKQFRQALRKIPTLRQSLSFNNDVSYLVMFMLKTDPEERPQTCDILRDRFFAKCL